MSMGGIETNELIISDGRPKHRTEKTKDKGKRNSMSRLTWNTEHRRKDKEAFLCAEQTNRIVRCYLLLEEERVSLFLFLNVELPPSCVNSLRWIRHCPSSIHPLERRGETMFTRRWLAKDKVHLPMYRILVIAVDWFECRTFWARLTHVDCRESVSRVSMDRRSLQRD